jgi:hypothetical protein
VLLALGKRRREIVAGIGHHVDHVSWRLPAEASTRPRARLGRLGSAERAHAYFPGAWQADVEAEIESRRR